MDSGTLIAGRYRLDSVIASGGMGAVWRAEDERLDRTVAVKVLHPGLSNTGRPQERFKVEAKILASLKGPGCVEIYDFGEEVDGDRPALFLVMELIEGVSLAELLHREKRLDAARTMQIMAEAAEALATAHKRGVVHRDIKPGNILIDSDDRVKVVDFGISLFEHNERLTPSGEVLGTAPYVSPEQLRDNDVSGASDLYALGAVAYECLAGTPPFNALDPAAVIHGHLYSEPPALPGDVPVEVAEVVTKSLKKAPKERWESGELLAAAARAATTGQFPVTAGPGRHRQETTPASVEPPSEATTADVTPAANPPFRAPSEPPVTPPSQPAAVEPPEEGPRRRRRMVFVGVAVAAVLAVFAVVAWSPWTGDGPGKDEANEGETTPAVATTAAEESSAATSPETSESAAETNAAEESSAEDGGTEGGGGDGGGDGGETDNEEEDSGGNDAAKEGSGTIPPVTGMTTFEARDYLNEQGFSNVVAATGMYAGWPEPEHCEVMGSDPGEGQTIDYQDRITLSYHYRDSVGTTCEW